VRQAQTRERTLTLAEIVRHCDEISDRQGEVVPAYGFTPSPAAKTRAIPALACYA
jgi:hypothetical protein